MHAKFELHRRLWADIVALPPGQVLVSSYSPESEQEDVVKYFIALYLRGLAEVRFAKSLRTPRVATLFRLTAKGKELQARKERHLPPTTKPARRKPRIFQPGAHVRK